MKENAEATIVTITDANFLIAVYLLITSLKFHKVNANINVLGVGLSAKEKSLLEQFASVRVFDGDLTNARNAATRKGEALLTAACDASTHITLLDGDCLVTGNISPYLVPEGRGLWARAKSPEEDGAVFASRYDDADVFGTIPRQVLDIWRADVGANDHPAISNTVCGGNLTLHSDYLWFAEKWQEQMMKVIPNEPTRIAHAPHLLAYSQLDESVLNALLAFIPGAPPVYRGHLDADRSAYVAHLGPCNPKPWILWRKEKVKYFDYVVQLLQWARLENYELPFIPWTFKRRNRLLARISHHIFRVGSNWVLQYSPMTVV